MTNENKQFRSFLKLYPIAKQEDFEVLIPGEGIINDPYKWMQNDKNTDTIIYKNSQEFAFQKHMHYIKNKTADIDDIQIKYKEIIKKVLTTSKINIPMNYGGKYYQFLNNGNFYNDILVVRNDYNDFSLDNLHIILNTNKKDDNNNKKSYVIIDYKFSNNYEYLGYVLLKKKSNQYDIHIFDLKINKKIEHLKAFDTTITWNHNDEGFFYSKINQNTKQHTIFYHQLKTSSEHDKICFSIQTNKIEAHRFYTEISYDYQYLFIYEKSTIYGNLVYMTKEHLQNDINKFEKYIQIICKWNANYKYVSNMNNYVVFLTNYKASYRQLIMIDFQNEENLKCIKNFKTLIKKSSCYIIEDAKPIQKDKILIFYRIALNKEQLIARDHLIVYKFKEDGNLQRLYKICSSKYAGYIKDIHTSYYTNEIFYMMENYNNPGSIYFFQHDDNKISNSDNNNNEKPKVIKLYQNKLPFNYRFQRKVITYKSYDSRPIYITMLYRIDNNRQIPKSILQPADDIDCPYFFLTGYGGFNYLHRPFYDQYAIIFTEIFHDSIYSIAHIRGNGEFGDNWHRSGMKFKKIRAINDFICVTNGLIKNRYTIRDKLIINGNHCGGFIIGNSINRKPNISCIALIKNGILDLIGPRKKRLYEQSLWLEFGDACDIDCGSKYQLSYSPYHNVAWPLNETDIFYPATIVIITADSQKFIHDYHSLKFIAALQDELTVVKTEQIPMLLRIEQEQNINEKIQRILDEFILIKFYLTMPRQEDD